MTVVKSITSADRTRRVEIYQRANGTFGFRDLRWLPEEGSWAPAGRYAESLSDSVGQALAEARTRVAWLASEP